MTSIEWFNQQLVDRQNGKCDSRSWDEIFKQAKEMHKQEKIDFAKYCLDRALDLDIRTAYSNVESYYNETFKK